MGRLSYTNRKIEGDKLAQITVKDLLKRIPPAAGHKAALRDPVLELDLANKALGDLCLQSVANALVQSIKYGSEQGRITILEELSLNHNRLTTQALAALTRVLQVSAGELRDLDLSYNVIEVNTDEEALIFERFLYSFSGCYTLRRIDLSGNELGPKAFEVLARVYGQQHIESHTLVSSPQIAIANGHDMRTKPLQDQDTNIDTSSSSPVRRKSSALRLRQKAHIGAGLENQSLAKTSPRKSLSPTEKANNDSYTFTRGLRSVPYLVFQDVNMTDACALYLSYIIPVHQSPDQLLLHVPPAKAGVAAQQLIAYDMQSGCLGIIYRPNRKLGAAGIRLLELSEQLRTGFSDSSDGDTSSFGAGVSPRSYRSPSVSTNEGRRGSGWSLHSVKRRTSDASSINDPDQMYQGFVEKTLWNLETTRHRIQGDILRDCGPHCNDLWTLALVILRVGRSVSLPLPKGKELQVESPPSNDNHPGLLDNIAISPTITPLQQRWKTHHGAPTLRLGRKWINDREELVQIPDSPSPTELASSSLKASTAQTSKESSPPLMTDIKPRKKPEDYFRGPYRSSLRFGFNERVWRTIISLATDADSYMGEVQQLKAIEYAMDRNTLVKETENLGKPGSAQCWKVLDAMGALEYEINA